MQILHQLDNQTLTVALSGRLDSNTVRELEEFLKQYLDQVSELVFDFRELEYISSAGLRVLLGCYKRLSGKMKVLNANEMITDIFKMTGMLSFFQPEY